MCMKLCCYNIENVYAASPQQKELQTLQKKVKYLEQEKMKLQKQLEQEKEIAQSSSGQSGNQEVQEKASFCACVHAFDLV